MEGVSSRNNTSNPSTLPMHEIIYLSDDDEGDTMEDNIIVTNHEYTAVKHRRVNPDFNKKNNTPSPHLTIVKSDILRKYHFKAFSNRGVGTQVHSRFPASSSINRIVGNYNRSTTEDEYADKGAIINDTSIIRRMVHYPGVFTPNKRADLNTSTRNVSEYIRPLNSCGKGSNTNKAEPVNSSVIVPGMTGSMKSLPYYFVDPSSLHVRRPENASSLVMRGRVGANKEQLKVCRCDNPSFPMVVNECPQGEHDYSMPPERQEMDVQLKDLRAMLNPKMSRGKPRPRNQKIVHERWCGFLRLLSRREISHIKTYLTQRADHDFQSDATGIHHTKKYIRERLAEKAVESMLASGHGRKVSDMTASLMNMVHGQMKEAQQLYERAMIPQECQTTESGLDERVMNILVKRVESRLESRRLRWSLWLHSLSEDEINKVAEYVNDSIEEKEMNEEGKEEDGDTKREIVMNEVRKELRVETMDTAISMLSELLLTGEWKNVEIADEDAHSKSRILTMGKSILKRSFEKYVTDRPRRKRGRPFKKFDNFTINNHD